jgi:hypothetical protein
MRTIKALAILLMLAASAQAAPKHSVRYDVCAVDGGKLALYAHFDKRPQAMAVADYLEQKNGRHFYVMVTDVSDTGDGK